MIWAICASLTDHRDFSDRDVYRVRLHDEVHSLRATDRHAVHPDLGSLVRLECAFAHAPGGDVRMRHMCARGEALSEAIQASPLGQPACLTPLFPIQLVAATMLELLLLPSPPHQVGSCCGGAKPFVP